MTARHQVPFAVAVALGALGCGSPAGAGAVPARPVESAAPAASVTVSASARSEAPPVIRAVWPEGIAKRGGPDVEPRAGHAYPLSVACEASGRFDLNALYDDPRCGINNGDARLTGWTRLVPVDAGPFVLRAVRDAPPIHARTDADFEVEVEIENMGADTELIQIDGDATPELFAVEAEPTDHCDPSQDASCLRGWGSVRGGTLEHGKRRSKNQWTGIRWKSHAIGVLRVSLAPTIEGPARHEGVVWRKTSAALPPRKYDLFSAGWRHEGQESKNLEKVGVLVFDEP